MKRYVLLENGAIVDRNKHIYQLADEILMVKQSDNLLDLVEAGDLIEMDNEWEMLKVLGFDNKGNIVCDVRTSSSIETYVFKEYRKKFVLAIWKRNGDIMRRYEV